MTTRAPHSASTNPPHRTDQPRCGGPARVLHTAGSRRHPLSCARPGLSSALNRILLRRGRWMGRRRAFLSARSVCLVSARLAASRAQTCAQIQSAHLRVLKRLGGPPQARVAVQGCGLRIPILRAWVAAGCPCQVADRSRPGPRTAGSSPALPVPCPCGGGSFCAGPPIGLGRHGSGLLPLPRPGWGDHRRHPPGGAGRRHVRGQSRLPPGLGKGLQAREHPRSTVGRVRLARPGPAWRSRRRLSWLKHLDELPVRRGLSPLPHLAVD